MQSLKRLNTGQEKEKKSLPMKHPPKLHLNARKGQHQEEGPEPNDFEFFRSWAENWEWKNRSVKMKRKLRSFLC